MGDGALADAPPDAPPGSAAPPVGHCHDGWCWVLPLPQGNEVRSLWGASDSDVWVVGNNGTTMHWNGANWTAHDAGDQGAQVWGAGSNNVFAAYSDGVWRWNGMEWSASATGRAYAVGGTSATDVWAFFDGNSPGAKQFDGTTWTNRPLPTPQWRTVAIGGTTRPLVVNAAGQIARWTGTAWAIATPANARLVTAAVVLDDTHIVASTDSGVLFWNGASWGGPPGAPATPLPSGRYDAVAATSYTDVYVHGYRYDGTTWAALPASPAWTKAWSPGGGRVWALSAKTALSAFDGTSWQSRATSTDRLVLDVWGAADDDFWVLTTNAVWRWNGSAWSQLPLPTPMPMQQTDAYVQVWGTGADDLWIAGARSPRGEDGQQLLVAHWDGTAWTSAVIGGDSSIMSAGITSLWGSAANDIYAASGYGLHHYDGVDWTRTEAVTSGVARVFGTSATDVYALGDVHSIGELGYWHRDATGWSAQQLPQAANYGWANSATDVWFSGNGTMQYDGAFFTTFSTGLVETMPIGTATDMLVIGNRTVWRWNGGATVSPVSKLKRFEGAHDGWRSPSGRVYLANLDGLLVHAP